MVVDHQATITWLAVVRRALISASSNGGSSVVTGTSNKGGCVAVQRSRMRAPPTMGCVPHSYNAVMLAPSLTEARLDDRYTAGHGRALMSGIQALVRLLIEQRRLDASRGLNTGVFVSGYPGSPLGGLDREIVRAREHLEPHGIVFNPAVNEELAATAVNGSQLIGELPGRTRDGVVGFWYGKAPGLDRAADAIRHGNVSGTAHLGGAVALIGDDPICKSSTLPSSCELMAESLMLPLLSPGGVGDIVRLGLHAVALSRAAGLWTAIKIVSDVADAAASVALDGLDAGIPEPPSESRGAPPMLLGASSVAAEHDLMGARLDAAREYGRAHGLNRIEFEARAGAPRPGRPGTGVRHPAPGARAAGHRRARAGGDGDPAGGTGAGVAASPRRRPGLRGGHARS